MDGAEKRRRCIEAADEDLRPWLNILFDRAALLERQTPGDKFLGYYDDVLDLTWRHLGRPGERDQGTSGYRAGPKPYDRPPDQPPKGEQDRRRP
jgi:hypothetical protein